MKKLFLVLLLVLMMVSLGNTQPFGGLPLGPTPGVPLTGGTITATKTSIHTFNETNWDEDDVTWTMTGTGPLVHVAGNTTAVTATNSEAIVINTTYRITITGTGGGGTATYTLGGVSGTTTIPASGAIAIEDYITASTTASMIITPTSACTVSITNITIEKLTDATGDLKVEGDLFVGSRIKSLGNIGIGTTAPKAKLSISNNVATPPIDTYGEYQILLYDTSLATTSYGQGIEAGYIWFNTNGGYKFYENGSNVRMLITNSGNIGIGTTSPHSTFHDAGSFATAIVNKTTNYTATSSDHIITCDATAAAVTINLPTAVGIAGRQYIIKKVDSSANACTVDPNGTETIDGATTYELATQWKYLTVVSNNMNWFVMGDN